MVSSELERARDTARRQAATYKALQERQKALKAQGFAYIGKRPIGKQDELLAEARAEYEQQMAQFRDDASLIRKRAEEKRTKGTLEGRAKVQHALDHGFDFPSLAKQLADEGDKEGLASLREYIPYAQKAGQLPLTDPKRPDAAIKNASEILSRYEPKLWSPQEAQVQAEVRELEISAGLVESNFRKLNDHLDYQQKSGDYPRSVQNIYRWAGLPAHDSHYDASAYQPGLEQLEAFSMNGRS